SVCPSRLRGSDPVATSHSCTAWKKVLRWEIEGILAPATSVLLSGENATEANVIRAIHSSERTLAPVAASQSHTVLSSAPVARVLPSGETATEETGSVYPSSMSVSAPLATFQSRTVLSSEPDASTLPSGENATDLTLSACPSSLFTSAPAATF